MLEQVYFELFEIEMISGEVTRAKHFLDKASEGNGFYAQVASIFVSALDGHQKPEEIEENIMALEGDEGEKKGIYFRFLYSWNRYDVNLPNYDSKRCDDA